MRTWLAAGAAAISTLTGSGNASKLRSHERFFSQLASGALQKAAGTLLPQAAAGMVSPGTFPSGAMAPTGTAPPETPPIPPVDAGIYSFV